MVKKSETEDSEGGSKSDGLEIVSIGALYQRGGPWDKKYWSSSRGRDRFPYPVGFQALRTHNGISYKMEIHEGSKGPIFQITSSEQQSSSGQSPNIAWENFQKKGCSRLKLGQGKRSSCNMDGVEFFGFRNALVQRLLREMVANANATPNGSSLIFDFCNKTSAKSPDKLLKRPCSYPDLLDHLAKPQVTRKRSRKCHRASMKSTCVGTPKRSHPLLLAETSSLGIQQRDNDWNLTASSSLNKERGVSDANGTLVERLVAEAEKEVPLSYDAVPSKSNEIPKKTQDKICVDAGDTFLDFTGSHVVVAPAVGNSDENGTTVDRFEKMETQLLGSSKGEQNVYKELPMNDPPDVNPLISEDSQLNNCIHLCAPDTFDIPQENTSFVDATMKSEDPPPSTNVESDATNIALTLRPINEVVPEVDSATWNSNDSFEKNEFYSVGDLCEEIAKSMMTVLLPQALPLLTYSRKTRKKAKASKKTHLEVKQEDEYHGTLPSASVASQGQAEVEVTSLYPGAAGSVLSVAPDSFEHEEFDYSLSNKVSFSSPNAVAVETNCVEGKSSSQSLGLISGGVDEYLKSASCHDEKPQESETLETSTIRLQDQVSVPTLAKISDEPEEQQTRSCCKSTYHEEVKPCTNERSYITFGPDDMLEDTSELIGCYLHPKRISSVILRREVHHIYACVSCGHMGERERKLFVYKIALEQPSRGCPAFMGYTSVLLPLLNDSFGNEVAVDKYGLDFTPDGQGLILLDGIKAPLCRLQKYDCQCASCASSCFEEIAVRIVQVKLGYASVVVKLKSSHPILCLLVFEPGHLVAVDESGSFYIWVMNSTWSKQTEEHVLHSYNYVASRVTELKRIPNSVALVLGHNGYGDFSLWDIKKRTMLSRFLSPESTVLQFLPVSYFSWPEEDLMHGKLDDKEWVNKIIQETMAWQLKHDKQCDFSLKEGEDIAVWLLICTASDSPTSPCYATNTRQKNPLACWRLALLIKNTVILGPVLDQRVTAVGSSSGLGIIGTQEGLAYIWDLSSGTVIETLHKFEGGGVSEIATSGSSPASIAIGGESGQLLVYLHF